MLRSSQFGHVAAVAFSGPHYQEMKMVLISIRMIIPRRKRSLNTVFEEQMAEEKEKEEMAKKNSRDAHKTPFSPR